MKTQILLASAALVLATTAAQAQLQSPAQMRADRDALVLEMSGERSWEVSCQVEQGDGDVIRGRERGRGLRHAGRIMVSEAAGGTCSYNVPERGELRLTMRVAHTTFDCPFEITDGGFCRVTLPAGASGSFRISHSRPAVLPGS